MGKSLWLFVLLSIFSHNSNAQYSPVPRSASDFIVKSPEGLVTPVPINKFLVSDAYVDYEKETLVVTASAVNKSGFEEDIMFGGKFTPSVGAYLKPLNSRLKLFMQVKCIDPSCQTMAVGMGVRTNQTNPGSYDRRFVVLSQETVANAQQKYLHGF